MKRVSISELVRKLFHSTRNRVGPEERRTIHCDTHGDADETFVCQHVIDGLIRKERVGFFWTAEDPDNPHVLLLGLIDELVRLGFLAEEQRLGAEIGAWSMVHGLAMLLIDGPLAALPPAERAAVVDQTLSTFTQSFWNARQPPSKNPRRR